MKIIKKILLFGLISFALIVVSSLIIIKIQGKGALESVLSEMIGSAVKFESVAFSLEEPSVKFKGFKVASEINFDKNIINAETFTIFLNEEKLKSEKKVVIDRVVIEKGTLNI